MQCKVRAFFIPVPLKRTLDRSAFFRYRNVFRALRVKQKMIFYFSKCLPKRSPFFLYPPFPVNEMTYLFLRFAFARRFFGLNALFLSRYLLPLRSTPLRIRYFLYAQTFGEHQKLKRLKTSSCSQLKLLKTIHQISSKTYH